MSIDSGESVEPMKLANVCAFVGVVRMKKLDLLMGMRKQGFRTNIECRRPGGAFHEGFGDPTLCNGRRTFSNFSGSLINAPFFLPFFGPPGFPSGLTARACGRVSFPPNAATGGHGARAERKTPAGVSPRASEKNRYRKKDEACDQACRIRSLTSAIASKVTSEPSWRPCSGWQGLHLRRQRLRS